MDEKQTRINANEHERKHWDLCHDIIEVFFAVYNELGFWLFRGRLRRSIVHGPC